MTTNDANRIHERIDDVCASIASIKDTMHTDKEDIKESIHSLTVKVTEWTTASIPCRRIVLGNGKDGIATRIDRLEQSESNRNAWFWIIVGGVPTVVSAVIVGIFRWVTGQ